MPLTPKDFSAITRLGGLANSKVKHVSRIDEENERVGQGLHKSPTMSGLKKLILHGLQLVDNSFGTVPAWHALRNLRQESDKQPRIHMNTQNIQMHRNSTDLHV